MFDVVASGCGLLLLSPVFLWLAGWVKLDSKGPVFYRQVRVGKHNKDFKLYKFRSMRVGADKAGLITVGGRDPRVTRSGYYIRKYKLDELPQLINVFLGDMSLVTVSAAIISCVRKTDRLVRYGGDEFLLVMPGISLEAFVEKLHRIQKKKG